jgi:hypothetical protein
MPVALVTSDVALAPLVAGCRSRQPVSGPPALPPPARLWHSAHGFGLVEGAQWATPSLTHLAGVQQAINLGHRDQVRVR